MEMWRRVFFFKTTSLPVGVINISKQFKRGIVWRSIRANSPQGLHNISRCSKICCNGSTCINIRKNISFLCFSAHLMSTLFFTQTLYKHFKWEYQMIKGKSPVVEQIIYFYTNTMKIPNTAGFSYQMQRVAWTQTFHSGTRWLTRAMRKITPLPYVKWPIINYV